MGLNEKFFKSADENEGFFNTVLYTGDGNADRDITGVGFTPDLVWIKNRDTSDSHQLYDSLRGANVLYSNGTDAQFSITDWEIIDDGFDLGAANIGKNGNGNDIVAWCFKAGGVPSGSDTVSIDGTSYADEAAAGLTAGNVAVTKLSANTKLGFSIATLDNVATYPSKSFSHGLGVPPELVIGKIYDGATDNWRVMSPLLGAANVLFLNTTAGTSAWSGFNNTNPDSNVINLAWSDDTNYKMIFYSFASKTGVSKVGSYTGANSSVFVNTGFEPAFVMIKFASGGSVGYGGWFIYDNKRDTTNPVSVFLQANTNGTEFDNLSYSISFNSTGFTVGSTQNDGINYNNNEYIYYAIAQ